MAASFLRLAKAVLSYLDSQYGTLVAATPATITLTAAKTGIEVINRSGSAEIFFTVDGTTTPTSGGQGTYCVPAVAGASVVVSPVFSGTNGAPLLVVKLISTGTPTYGVAGLG